MSAEKLREAARLMRERAGAATPDICPEWTRSAAMCSDPFPGEQAWICSQPNGHHGPHREGNVAWSSGGSQVPDRHTNEGMHS